MIAHACIMLRAGPVGLLSDPWLDGKIFNWSWAPLFPTMLRLDDFAALTHVWVSHEHPDHLHFPSLRTIPADIRARITLLYQRHPQRAVVQALSEFGFKEVIELAPSRWYELAAGVEVACYPSRRVDSALAIRAGGVTVLNVNDCKLGDWYLRQIRRHIGPIDLLLGQYSIAGWVANSGQTATDKRLKVIRRTARYCNVLCPRSLGLFASHAWFCHAENMYMNDLAIGPREALSYLSNSGQAAMHTRAMMPRDQWRTGIGFTSISDGLETYDLAVATRRAQLPVPSEHHTLEEIQAAANNYLTNLRAVHPSIRMTLPKTPCLFHIDDLGVSVALSLQEFKLHVVPVLRADCHLALMSQALLFCFLFRWGFDTLDTSGRYTLLSRTKDHPVLSYCYAFGAAYKTDGAFGWFERLSHHMARRGEYLDELAAAWLSVCWRLRQLFR